MTELTDDTYTFSVYATPMSFPFTLSIHSWVEITHNTDVTRYDLWGYPGIDPTTPSEGFIYQDIFPNHLGTTFTPFAKAYDLHKRQSGNILFTCTGGTNSPAATYYHEIKKRVFSYPYAHRYSMFRGPNCNTFTQWIINLVPESGYTLPWYAWGKHYPVPKYI